MAVVKYDGAMCSRIIELSSLGYSLTEISKMVGVTRMTLYRWIKKNKLQGAIDSAERDMMAGTIKRGLKALSEGATSKETIRESIEDDGDGHISKITEKTKTLAPSEKAIQILAQKYAKEFSKSELEEINKVLAISMNTSTMTLRELQQVDSPLGSVVPVAPNDYSRLEVSEDLVPPMKDE